MNTTSELKELLREAATISKELKFQVEKAASDGGKAAVTMLKTTDEYKTQLQLIKDINDKVLELKNIQNTALASIASQESGLKSLGGLYSNIGKIERQRLTLQSNMLGMDKDKVEIFDKIAELNISLANTSKEDVFTKQSINAELLLQNSLLEGSTGNYARIRNLLKDETKYASSISQLTEEQKSQLEDQIEVYKGIKKTINGVLDTAKLLTKGTAGFIGITLAGAGKIADKWGEVRAELGGVAHSGTVIMAFFDDEAVETAKSLSAQFGGMERIGLGVEASTYLISKNMGVSGDDAGKLMGRFARLNGNSLEVAQNMIKTSQQFALQNDIIPSELLKDLAGSSEEFALWGKRGGLNMLEAAGYAKKMGVELKTITTMADGLLDFESSINNELELGALLGKNINLNEARSLAFQGKLKEAAAEELRQLGGREGFERMNYFQKKKAAELLGTTVAELEKMVTQEENANSMGAVIGEKFSKWGESIDLFLNKGLGTSLEALGGLVIAAGQFNMAMMGTGVSIGGIVKGTGQMLKNLISMLTPTKLLEGAKLFGSSVTNSGMGKGIKGFFGKLTQGVGGTSPTPITTPSVAPTTPPTTGAAENASKFGKINAMSLIKGAAAMLIMAGALWVFAKALKEFEGVDWKMIGMATASIGVLALAMVALGAIMNSPLGALMLEGAFAMLVMAAATLVLGKGIQALAEGFKSMGDVSDQLMILSQINFLPILGLAGALTALAYSLGLVAATGALALPILNGINTVSGMLGLTDNSKSDNSDLLTEIKGLRDDLASGKIAVYMDGKKVTAAVSTVVDKQGKNAFSAKKQ